MRKLLKKYKSTGFFTHPLNIYTKCPRSLDQFHTVTNYMKMGEKTSWTDSINLLSVSVSTSVCAPDAKCSDISFVGI